MSHSFPKQNIPHKKKDREWQKHSVNALVDSTTFEGATYSSIMKYYDAANGVLFPDDYNYVTQPYTSSKVDEANDRQFPARLRNQDILGNVRDILLGERRKRPFNHDVVTTNDDSIERYEEDKGEFTRQQLRQNLINKLEEYGLNQTGEEPQKQDDLTKVMDKFDQEWKDERGIQGQHALNHIKEKEEIFDRTQDAWNDLISVGRAFSYRGIQHNEPVYEIVPPWELDFGGSEGVRFLEDCDWCVRRTNMTKTQILETFWKEIEENDIDINDIDSDPGQTLAGGGQKMTTGTDQGFPMLSGSLEENIDSADSENLVYHCVWKSMKRIGILYYMDEMGQPQEMEVSEEFEPNEDDDIEWYWVNEVWEGYRINDDYFLGIQPLAIQRESDNNKSDCKLPYNGVLAVSRGSQNISLIQKGYPYQVLYNIYHYRLEWGIAKNKGKIAMMDVSLFPNDNGWSTADTFYFMDTMNMLLFDGSKQQNQQVMQGLKDIDLSFYEFISSHVELLNQIRSEWEEMAGISRQRKGDVSAYAGKGATEQAVYNSATITEEMFAQFESFVQRDLQALMDYSKISWVDGKRVMHMDENAIPKHFELDPVQHAESHYGIYVSSGSADTDKFRMLQEIIPTMAQQNVSPAIIAEMMDADNFPTLKQKLKQADEELEKQQKEAAQAEQKQKEMEFKEKDKQREHDASQGELDRESKEYIAQLDARAEIYKHDTQEERAERQHDKEQASKEEELNRKDQNERDKRMEEKQEKREDRVKEREQKIRDDNREREKISIDRESNNIDREKIKTDKELKKMELLNPASGEEQSDKMKKRKQKATKNNDNN